MVGHKLPVISVQNLLLLWRPDVIVLLITGVLLAGYLLRVRRLAAAGTGWPTVARDEVVGRDPIREDSPEGTRRRRSRATQGRPGRTCWAITAAVATVVVLNSGVASYVTAVWSVTVTQQAVTSMLIPLAIVLARPGQLVGTRWRGDAHRTLAAHPGLVLAAYLGWTAAVLLTPVALWSVSNHAVLMVSRLGDIAVGTLLFAVVLPSSEAVASRRATGRMRWLIGWFAGQALLSWLLLVGGAAAARPWFVELNIAWITVPQDEQTAAVLRVVVAVVVLAVAATKISLTARTTRTKQHHPAASVLE